MQLLKAGPEPRKAVVAWLSEALSLNTGSEASQPDAAKTASDGFLINLGTALLKLSMPFVTDAAKFASKVDAHSVMEVPTAWCGVFPYDTTPLVAAPEGAPDKKQVLLYIPTVCTIHAILCIEPYCNVLVRTHVLCCSSSSNVIDNTALYVCYLQQYACWYMYQYQATAELRCTFSKCQDSRLSCYQALLSF
jgi:Ubiquitin elongating factor core